jgi:hypothetical protein
MGLEWLFVHEGRFKFSSPSFSVAKNDSAFTSPHQSFIASVNLRTSILWFGGIKAEWDEARASDKNEQNVTSSRTAEKYTLVLKKIGG